MEKLWEEKGIALRHALHAVPEVSGREEKTRALLEAFLRENTTLEVRNEGLWLWALHREDVNERIAFRADFDALPSQEGAPRHLCGHDGHAAALCMLALAIEGQRLNRSVYLIFQYGEETGMGGKACAELIGREGIDEVYGCHNLPGYPLGRVCLRKGTFACASRGLILSFTGTSAHAAYPENGINPAPLLGKLLCELPKLTEAGLYRELVMATVVGVRAGQRAFGMAAAEGELDLTLRAHRNADLEALEARILKLCSEGSAAAGLKFACERMDVFPATENDDACVARVAAAATDALWLEEPMRWSEDFGWYLLAGRGAFFGIGSGEGCPALHTPGYEYPDALLSRTAEIFYALATHK